MPRISFQLSVTLSRAARSGNAGSRVTTNRTAATTYGDQARSRPILSPPAASSAGASMVTGAPPHRGSQFSRGGNVQTGSSPSKNRFFAAGTTIASPTKLPSRLGNSGPRSQATARYGDDERQGAEQRERPNRQRRARRAVGSEQPAEHGEQQARHEQAAYSVDGGGVRADRSDERVVCNARSVQRVHHRRNVERLAHADDDRCTYSSEGHGRALDNQRRGTRGQRREPQGHHQRSGDGRRCAEARSPLHERAEEPGDDQRLDTGVGRDVVETGADRRHSAGLAQGVQKHQGRENDPQQRRGDHHAAQRRCNDDAGRHLPGPQSGHHSYSISHRHGAGRRPAGQDQQRKDRQQWGEGRDRQEHRGTLSLTVGLFRRLFPAPGA